MTLGRARKLLLSSLCTVAFVVGSGAAAVGGVASAASGADGAAPHAVAGARAWRVERAPVLTGAAGSLTDVSCPAIKFCVAVGYNDNGVANSGLVEFWNGSRWRIGTAPSGGDSSLTAVDCVSRRFCAAVTDDALFTWNGTVWRRQTVPGQSDSASPVMADVSCSSPSACTAVGDMQPPAGDERPSRSRSAAAGAVAAGPGPLVQRWDGRKWTSQHQAAAVSALSGVSCPADSACVAVGQSDTGAPLIERWSSAGWTVQTAVADPGYRVGVLSAVSCPTVAACVAVGSQARDPMAAPNDPLTELWDGAAWTTRRFAPDAAAHTSFAGAGVSCASATSCVAIADSVRRSQTLMVVGESWNGVTWSRQSSRPARPNAWIGGLDCAAATVCMAAGGNFVEKGPVAASWDGRIWSDARPAVPRVPLSAMLAAVSCSTRTSCVAVGWRSRTSSLDEFAQVLYVIRRTRSGWHHQRVPVGPQASSTLTSVSCPSRNWCLATGSADTRGLVERWNGRTWRRLHAPSPPIDRQTVSEISAVSCTSRRFCVLIGRTQKYVDRLFAAVGRPGHWKRYRLALPRRASKELSALSCRNRHDCLAVGNFTDRGTAFSMHWNGTRWTPTMVRPRHRSGKNLLRLTSVSCPPRGACIAVGALGLRLIARAWRDGAWHRLPNPPRLSGKAVIAGLSCPRASACTGVGTGAAGPVAIRWNGRRWRIVSRGPAPVRDLGLNSVSCPTSRTCTAVGGDVSFNRPVSAPLIERSTANR